MNAKRVARRFLAAFFNVGDIVLYGKYKNKKGRILSFGQDAKGNPTVTIESVPKGRKQDKTMTLFKVWKQPLEKQAMTLSKRVVSRFIQADGIPLGKTYEHGDLRFHRYTGAFVITELTNAGKRGKKVRQMTLGLNITRDQDPWYDNFAKLLPKIDSYNELKSLIKDVQSQYPNEIRMDERELRGVDVNPGGSTKINLTTNEGLRITAEPDSFLVTVSHEFENKDKTNKFNQDTTYYSVSKKDAAPFYNWLKGNLSEANKLDIDGFRKICDELKIRYDFH